MEYSDVGLPRVKQNFLPTWDVWCVDILPKGTFRYYSRNCQPDFPSRIIKQSDLYWMQMRHTETGNISS